MGPPMGPWWDPPKFLTEKIGPENCINNPPPPRIPEPHIDYPPRNRAGKLHQLPPPPRIHGTSSTTPPPRNRAGKLHQLPPLEFTNLIDYPPRRNRLFGPPQLLKRGGAPDCLEYLFSNLIEWDRIKCKTLLNSKIERICIITTRRGSDMIWDYMVNGLAHYLHRSRSLNDILDAEYLANGSR